jgi:hypothetical protein
MAQCLEYGQKLLFEEQQFRASHVYVLLTDGEVIQLFKVVRMANIAHQETAITDQHVKYYSTRVSKLSEPEGRKVLYNMLTVSDEDLGYTMPPMKVSKVDSTDPKHAPLMNAEFKMVRFMGSGAHASVYAVEHKVSCILLALLVISLLIIKTFLQTFVGFDFQDTQLIMKYFPDYREATAEADILLKLKPPTDSAASYRFTTLIGRMGSNSLLLDPVAIQFINSWGDLSACLDRPVAENRRTRVTKWVLTAVVDALQDLHQTQNVIHRDIKVENIMMVFDPITKVHSNQLFFCSDCDVLVCTSENMRALAFSIFSPEV